MRLSIAAIFLAFPAAVIGHGDHGQKQQHRWSQTFDDHRSWQDDDWRNFRGWQKHNDEYHHKMEQDTRRANIPTCPPGYTSGVKLEHDYRGYRVKSNSPIKKDFECDPFFESLESDGPPVHRNTIKRNTMNPEDGIKPGKGPDTCTVDAWANIWVQGASEFHYLYEIEGKPWDVKSRGYPPPAMDGNDLVWDGSFQCCVPVTDSCAHDPQVWTNDSFCPPNTFRDPAKYDRRFKDKTKCCTNSATCSDLICDDLPGYTADASKANVHCSNSKTSCVASECCAVKENTCLSVHKYIGGIVKGSGWDDDEEDINPNRKYCSTATEDELRYPTYAGFDPEKFGNTPKTVECDGSYSAFRKGDKLTASNSNPSGSLCVDDSCCGLLKTPTPTPEDVRRRRAKINAVAAAMLEVEPDTLNLVKGVFSSSAKKDATLAIAKVCDYMKDAKVTYNYDPYDVPFCIDLSLEAQPLTCGDFTCPAGYRQRTGETSTRRFDGGSGAGRTIEKEEAISSATVLYGEKEAGQLNEVGFGHIATGRRNKVCCELIPNSCLAAALKAKSEVANREFYQEYCTSNRPEGFCGRYKEFCTNPTPEAAGGESWDGESYAQIVANKYSKCSTFAEATEAPEWDGYCPGSWEMYGTHTGDRGQYPVKPRTGVIDPAKFGHDAGLGQKEAQDNCCRFKWSCSDVADVDGQLLWTGGYKIWDDDAKFDDDVDDDLKYGLRYMGGGYRRRGCFHGETEFLGGDGSPVAVSKLKVGDSMMVMEESNRADPALGVPSKATIVGWTTRPLPEGATTASGECSGRTNSFVEITYSCGTDCTGAMSVTTTHYIRVNAGARSVLKLAGEVSEGEEIEVWSANANGIVAGKITGVRGFEDDVAAVYSPITDKGTNFVAASGAVVPMVGETMIDGVVVNHNYITMLHNGLLTVKQLVPAALWDTAFAPGLAPEPSILEVCAESSVFMNNMVRALRANNSEGLSLVAAVIVDHTNHTEYPVDHTDLGNSAEVMQWAASNIFNIVGVEDTGAWSVQSAVTATAGLALEAASQLAFKTGTGTAVKIDVTKNSEWIDVTKAPTKAPTKTPTKAPTKTPTSIPGSGTGSGLSTGVVVVIILIVLFVFVCLVFAICKTSKRDAGKVHGEDQIVRVDARAGA